MSHNLDKIVYINLDRRPDRKQSIETQLSEHTLLDKSERFAAIDYPSFGIYGCGMSHLSVIKEAKKNGYKNVLILEDDFVFLVESTVFESELAQFFDANIEFDICMISYVLISGTTLSEYPFITRIKEAQTASGYIVNSSYYDTMIALYEDAMPKLLSTRHHWEYANDQIWKKLQIQDNWFCFKTRIGKQMDGYSDNANAFMSYNS